MLRAFNCGIGLIVVCRPEKLSATRTALVDAGESPVEIGRIAPREGTGAAVVYKGSLFS